MIELETIGYKFSIKGHDIAYTYKKWQIPTPEFIKLRLMSIKAHKSEVIKWLGKRTISDIADYLDRLTQKAECQAKKMEEEEGENSILAESWWEYFTKLYISSLEVRALAEREQKYANDG